MYPAVECCQGSPPLRHLPSTSTTGGRSGPVEELHLVRNITLPPWAAIYIQIPSPWRGNHTALYTLGNLPEHIPAAPSLSAGPNSTICLTNLVMEPITLQCKWGVGSVTIISLFQPVTIPMYHGGRHCIEVAGAALLPQPH